MADQDPSKKIADRYLKREVLGEGTYGVVYKAIDTHTEQTVAIKKIRKDKQKEGVDFMALREIKLLKELKDQNIIELIDTFPHKGNLHLVFEFMETDLEAVIKDQKIFLSPADTKSYVQMMLKGVAFCHKKWVLHRDLKPNNLLIGSNGQLKLGDFGLARLFGSPNRKFTHQCYYYSPLYDASRKGEPCITVFTRWYRAPELLFGSTQYASWVDVWASACIFAELLLRRPFLQGSSDIDQLGKIFSAFGTPTPSQWPDMEYLPDYVQFQYVPAPPLRSLFPMASDDALDLLSKMFTYNPMARISAQEALEHKYFFSEPLPTVPHKLPRPVPKKESGVSEEGPTVLPPPNKSRKVMPGCDGFEENSLSEGTANGNVGDNTGNNEPAPISTDSSIPGLKPPNSSTINRLKRKLDTEFQKPKMQ